MMKEQTAKNINNQNQVNIAEEASWKEIQERYPEFKDTEGLRKEWKERGFSGKRCKELMDIGLKPKDSGYAWWLENTETLDNYLTKLTESEKLLLKHKEHKEYDEECKKCNDHLKEQYKKYKKEVNETAWAIPLERLYVVRSNMKKFHNKWGKKPKNEHWYASSKDFYEKCRRLLHEWSAYRKLFQRLPIKSEVSNLMNPDKRIRFASTISQWGNRATTLVTGFYALSNQDTKLGAIITATYLPIEVVTSTTKRYFDFKKEKWDEFEVDAEELWDNYVELIGIIESITPLEEANKRVKELIDKLNKKILAFVGEEHDTDKDNKINIVEVEGISKESFTKDLSEEWDNKEKRKLNLEKKLAELVKTNKVKVSEEKKNLPLKDKIESVELKIKSTHSKIKQLKNDLKDQEEPTQDEIKKLEKYGNWLKMLIIQLQLCEHKKGKKLIKEKEVCLKEVTEAIEKLERKIIGYRQVKINLNHDDIGNIEDVNKCYKIMKQQENLKQEEEEPRGAQEKKDTQKTKTQWWKNFFRGTKGENEPSLREQLSLNNSEVTIELDEWEKENEQKAQIEQPPYGTASSSR